MTFSVASDPSHGTLNLTAAGVVAYVPEVGFVGTDQFEFLISDGLASSTGTFTIQVTNTPPTAHTATAIVRHDQTLPGSVAGFDSDGDPVTFSMASPPLHGSLTLNADGNYLYNPTPGFAGPDSFDFLATDGIADGIATVFINVLNSPPQANFIPDQYLGLHPGGTRSVDLTQYFEDADDSGAALTYRVVSISDSSLLFTNGNPDIPAADAGLLSIGAAGSHGGIASVTVRATDPLGESAEATFSVYVVEVHGITIEQREADGTWSPVPDFVALWDDGQYRFTPLFSPAPPIIDSIDWLERPWSDAMAPWSSFAIQTPDSPAETNPGQGDWEVTPRINFAGTFALMQAPPRVPVAKLTEVKWQPHTYADGLAAFSENDNPNGGGDRIYAEKRDFTEDSEVHNLGDVQVTISWTVAAGWTATAFLKAFDPDHYSSDDDFDPPSGTVNLTAKDNVGAGGTAITPGGDLALLSLTFNSGETQKSTDFRIARRQPGNNFIVAANGIQSTVNAMTFAADGVTLMNPATGAAVPASSQTRILTVWRTLWIEEDSMRPPADNEVFDPAGTIQHDEPPGDIGGPTGVFAQPKLGLLTSEFAKANVTVRKVDSAVDSRDEAIFAHNFADVDSAANASVDIRDTISELDRWSIQVFAAYEYLETEDGDPPPLVQDEDRTHGSTRESESLSVNVYLETIRDVWDDVPGTVHYATVAERVVLHECMHLFGHAAHYTGPMLPGNVRSGTQTQNELTSSMLREIMIRAKP